MFSRQFRLIPKEKKPSKLKLNQREDRGVSGIALIPDGHYLFPVKWNGKNGDATCDSVKKLGTTLDFGNRCT
jgi:hypothetical protein